MIFTMAFHNGMCQSCKIEDYKCILQQRYTYLEMNLDSQSGLISKLFEKKIISFTQKKSIESTGIIYDRNRKVIDLFFEEKTRKNYMSFLDCLDECSQSHIRQELESVSSCLSDIVNSPILYPFGSGEKDLMKVGCVEIDGKLAIIGLCYANNCIYAICHMDPRLFVFLSQPPFPRLKDYEFDLPVIPSQFHFYDMVSYPDGKTLVISDKAYPCLWVVNTDQKMAVSCKMNDARPYRMSLSDWCYEDIYRDNMTTVQDSTATSNYNEIENLFVGRDGKSCYNHVTCNTKEQCITDLMHNINLSNRGHQMFPAKSLLVVVLVNNSYCVDIYTDLPQSTFFKRYPLMLPGDMTVSNVVQRGTDGHYFLCYGKLDFGDINNSQWFLGEYSPEGQMLKCHKSPRQVWIPRYIALNDVDGTIYAISRYSDELLKLNWDDVNENLLRVTPVLSCKGLFSLPSRLCFVYKDISRTIAVDKNSSRSFVLLVGQGEINHPKTPATILILEKSI